MFWVKHETGLRHRLPGGRSLPLTYLHPTDTFVKRIFPSQPSAVCALTSQTHFYRAGTFCESQTHSQDFDIVKSNELSLCVESSLTREMVYFNECTVKDYYQNLCRRRAIRSDAENLSNEDRLSDSDSTVSDTCSDSNVSNVSSIL
jgi:hypothetical protein